VHNQNALALDAAYEFSGQSISLPVIVRKARASAATFMVSAAAAQALLPDDRLEIVEFLPGKTLFSLGGIDYIENDLGDYNELSMAFFVRMRGTPRGVPYGGAWTDFLRGRAATYIHRLPVNQAFTCDAGRGIWGFPKTVEDVGFETSAGRVRCDLAMGGRHVLTLDAPSGGTRMIPDATMQTYSYIDGRLHSTEFRSGADAVGFALGGARLTLGDHPVADELRALGLPKPSLMSVWMGHMRGRFEAPTPL
jgi:hypothetical protein